MPNPTALDRSATLNRMLAVMVALVVVAALKWSYPVTMPLAAAGFLLAVVWPMKPWLDRRLPGAVSNLIIFLSFGAVSAALIAMVFVAVDRLVATFRRRQDEFGELIEQARDWAQARGLSGLEGEDLVGRLAGYVDLVATETYTVLGYLGLIAVLVILGLPEIPGFRRRLRGRLRSERDRGDGAFETIDLITRRFRQYLGLTVFTSFLTGLASGLFAWAVGLELALTWGVLNFLLNFVPVIGNIIGMVPPTLYAVLQFDGAELPALVFAGMAVIQITISNFIYPVLQGRGMALPAVTIIVALTFWGWVWGAVGALLAIPLTASFLIAMDHFESTSWIARLMIRDDRGAKAAGAAVPSAQQS